MLNIVRYVVANNNGVLRTLPAIVVNQFGGQDGPPTLNLQVILDGMNSLSDGFSADDCAQGMAWRGTVTAGSGVGGWVQTDEPTQQPDHGGGSYGASQIEELVCLAISTYDSVVTSTTPEEAVTAAVQATMYLGQQIDMLDGVDDEVEDEAHYRPYIELAIQTYKASQATHDLAVAEAVAAVIAASQQRNNQGGPGEPSQGQVNPDGSFITLTQFYGSDPQSWPDHGATMTGDYCWTPQAPNPESPDWATAPWVWRPALNG